MIKITVKETIEKLQEKNKSPRRVFNKSEVTMLVQAILSDSEYIAQQLKIKEGKFIKEDRHLSKEFKKALTDILKQLGLKSDEALSIVAEYKVPKSLAAAVIDAVHHADHVYMDQVGKGIKFLGAGDVDQVFFMREIGERERQYRVPKDKDGNVRPSEYSRIRIKKHRRISAKTRYNPEAKTLLK
jgi:hypothetical protein